jgi:hypothetical protein
MKRLTKQKRDQLILVTLVILTVLIGLWFLAIRIQKEGLNTLRGEKVEKETKETQMRDKINTSKSVEAELTNVASKLVEKEESMVSGDPYAPREYDPEIQTALQTGNPAIQSRRVSDRCGSVAEIPLQAD